ncbi:MAG TPA: 50S ribosomal protein L21 [Candidatus Paceibacterota bacterium]|nr:50S ribosomal protein L21 [Candidatus Paceibacterota bacterium]
MATETTKKAVKKAPEAAPKAEKAVPKAAHKAEKSLPEGAFAVIMTGGKQYKVRVGDVLAVEKMTGDFKVGDKIVFDKVLLVDNAGETVVGKPFVAGSTVAAELVEIGRHDKVTVVHYKQKSKYFKKYGHKQPFFKVKVSAIA